MIKFCIYYINSIIFYIDCLCLLLLDFFYFFIGFCLILCCFWFVKVYRFWVFLDWIEWYINYLNFMRIVMLMYYLLVLFYWNVCLYYIVVMKFDWDFRMWEIFKDMDDVFWMYLYGFYWSILMFMMIGNLLMLVIN